MAWQQNPRLAQLYQDLDEYNNLQAIERRDKQELVEQNMMARKIMSAMNDEIVRFKREITGSIYEKLKREMWEHSELLGEDKARKAIREELDLTLDGRVEEIVNNLLEKYKMK